MVFALVQALGVLQLDEALLDLVEEGAFDPIRGFLEEGKPFLEGRDEAVQPLVIHERNLQFRPGPDLVFYPGVSQVILDVHDLIQNLAVLFDKYEASQHHIPLQFFDILFG